MAETTDERRTDIERAWITILAEYWRQTDWEQFDGQQKRRAKSFGERVEVATRAGDVHGALDKLAKGLGMAAPKLPTEQLDTLISEERTAMRILRREDIYLVNKADETVQNFFDALDNDESGEPEQTTTALSDFVTTE